MSAITFEIPEKGTIEVKLSDNSITRSVSSIGLFTMGLLNVKYCDANGKLIYDGGVTLLPHGQGKLYHPNGNL